VLCRFNATYRQSKNSKQKGAKGNAAVSGKIKKAVPTRKHIPTRPILSSAATSRSNTVPTSETSMEQSLAGANKLQRKPPFVPFATPAVRLLTNKELRDRFLPVSAHESDEDPEYEDDGDDEDAGLSDEEIADASAAATDSDDPDFEGSQRVLPARVRPRIRKY
jgi:hypothetical protein